SSDATHPKALSASNSSELAGMRHSYAAFSMGCKTREPNAIALPVQEWVKCNQNESGKNEGDQQNKAHSDIEEPFRQLVEHELCTGTRRTMNTFILEDRHRRVHFHIKHFKRAPGHKQYNQLTGH
ncbi:hypothetical protein, partial [Oceaniovalibus sp. ACAM 378]|uniref:hypothetical protein n=1 Tax=Oceaniovalibus sp. ACAM 378 TaxID=2599923 RepID=UPI001CA3600E